MNILEFLKQKLRHPFPAAFVEEMTYNGPKRDVVILRKDPEAIKMLAARWTLTCLEFLAEKRGRLIHMTVMAKIPYHYSPREIIPEAPLLPGNCPLYVKRYTHATLDHAPVLEDWKAGAPLLSTYVDEDAFTKFFAKYKGSRGNLVRKYIGGFVIDTGHIWSDPSGHTEEVIDYIYSGNEQPTSTVRQLSVSGGPIMSIACSFFLCANGKIVSHSQQVHTPWAPRQNHYDLEKIPTNVSTASPASVSYGIYRSLLLLSGIEDENRRAAAVFNVHTEEAASINKARQIGNEHDIVRLRQLEKIPDEYISQLYAQQFEYHLNGGGVSGSEYSFLSGPYSVITKEIK